MSNRPVYIKEIEIADYKCFIGRHKFSFTDEKGDWCRWTVFLGNNNTGKTNLLKLISEIDSWTVLLRNIPIVRKYGPIHLGINNFRAVKIMSSNGEANIQYDDKQQFLRDTQFSDSSLWKLLHINAYGVIRRIETKGISENQQTSNYSLLNNSDLINFEEWLFQLDYAAKNEQEKAADKRDLLINVLKSDIFPEINDIRFTSNEKAENYIEYQTKDGWYRLYELGYGYQAMLAWLMDFAKKMFDRYPDSKNPLKEPAVLLVDEIDLHLHPYWQRTIIKFLSDLLPQTQFIVTTHSPFILQSMESVNLYTLRREGDHTIFKHIGNQSFIGWSIEEILREIMELGDDVYTDHYQKLSKQFYEAITENNKQKAETAYDALVKILNPESVERKLMKIQLSQITSSL